MSLLGEKFIQVGNRVVDALLQVDRSEVLNTGSAQVNSLNPAQEMMKASKELLAEGLDSESGRVKYGSLCDSETYKRFREITLSLPRCTPDDIGAGDQATAFWINIYNALIIDGIIHYDVKGSLLRKPGFFRQTAYKIGAMRFSADDIEHGVLRQNRPNPALPLPVFTPSDPRNQIHMPAFDPRIHFALVCGANSCPPVAFYEHKELENQLDLAAGAFVNGSGVRFDEETRTLSLSRIFKWYAADFGGQEGILQTIQGHLKDQELIETISSGQFRVRYLAYDWSVNRGA